jgi:hypothetical protein
VYEAVIAELLEDGDSPLQGIDVAGEGYERSRWTV